MGCGDHGDSVIKEILKVLLLFLFFFFLHNHFTKKKKKKKPLDKAQFQKEDK